MNELRKSPAARIRRRVEVLYGLEEPTLRGYSGNISRTGIMIRCTRVFGPGLLLRMLIKFPDQEIQVRGRITWARKGSISLLSTGRVGMGVRFIDPPEELLARVQMGN